MTPTYTHSDREFRALLDWFMVSDPWPLDDDAGDIIKTMLAEESADRGYNNWVESYHEFEVGENE